MAETELKNIAAIPYQIVSPASNSPIIGVFQDSLLGSFRFTRKGVDFTPKEAMNLLMAIPNISVNRLQDAIYGEDAGPKSKMHRMSNFDILTQIMPPLTLLQKNKQYDDGKDNYCDSNHVIEIRNGAMIRGQIDSTIKTVIHRIYNDFGYMATSDFIDDLQSIITEYMKTSAFSVGISDLLTDAKTALKIKEIINKQKTKVKEVMDQVHLGIFENNTSFSNMERFEMEVRNLLNTVGDETGKEVRKSLHPDNRFVTIISSGSKGSLLNLSQMITCVGQQNVEGKRVPYGFDSRTLPHYTKYDDSPNARGFIENSYISGLTAEEVFFHAMSGRIGLIDTAVKSVTWETPIVIIQNKKPVYTEIGKWVDGQLDNVDNEKEVQHFPNDRNLELLNLKEGQVYIPTTCEKGIVSWEEVTAITRHDPGTILYKIKTQGGREVIVSESKSLLIWDDMKQGFYEKDSPEIKVGDALPVTMNLPEPPVTITGRTKDDAEQLGNYFTGETDYDYYAEITGNRSYLPDEVLIANKEFVQELLPYLLSRPFVKRVSEGINMLLTRFGIFGSLIELESGYSVAIHPKHVELFKRCFGFHPTVVSGWNFQQHNNVVMDPIVEISTVGVENYPKLYDLTIPTTLNFALANGLQVRDTSQTGYIQRRLIKGLEDLKVEYDMTVRNNKKKIVQFQYGDDNFDPTKVENQPIKLVGMSLEDIYSHYDFMGLTGDKGDANLKTIYNDAALTRYRKQKDELKKQAKKYIDLMVQRRNDIVNFVFKGRTDDVVKLPVAFHCMITNLQGQLDLNANSLVDITPVEAFRMSEEFMEKLRGYHYVRVFDMFETLYYFHLCPRELIEKKRFNRAALTVLHETILLRFKQALVSPGEMVGVVAGQSIGEPTTQLTLNTFHTAGSAKSNATRGVPRIEEILRLTKNPKSPSITVFLKDQDRFSKDRATAYTKIMKYMKLVNVVKNVEIVFDPIDTRTQMIEDQPLLNQFYEFEKMVQEASGQNAKSSSNEETKVMENRSKWILRMEIDSETLFENNMTMDDIHYAIKNSHVGPFVHCVYSDFNSDQLIFRISIDVAAFNKKKAVQSLDQTDHIYLLKLFQDSLLNNIVLRGVEGIKNVLLREVKNMVVEEDGLFKKRDMYVLDTTGTNLLEVLSLDFIDKQKTYSNDIAEIFDVLGIEATRQSIFNEMEEVMESSGSVYINYHHLSLLCDRMTSTKGLVAIFRSGILNDDIGPIAKATFEVQTDEFLKAARHGELDAMRGVSANVMCGQTGFYGTHAFNVVVDFKKFNNVAYSDKSHEGQETWDKQLKTKVSQLDNCSDMSEIENSISQVKPSNTTSCGFMKDGYEMDF